jgi:hypothetical protein
MNALLNDHRSPVSQAVETLVSEHGVRAVMAALMLRILRPSPAARAPMIGDLPNHLRHDIGLPPIEAERPQPPIPLVPPFF